MSFMPGFGWDYVDIKDEAVMQELRMYLNDIKSTLQSLREYSETLLENEQVKEVYDALYISNETFKHYDKDFKHIVAPLDYWRVPSLLQDLINLK